MSATEKKKRLSVGFALAPTITEYDGGEAATPARHRRSRSSILANPSPRQALVLLDHNDDEAEKREMRKKKRRETLGASPFQSPSSTSKSRRKSLVDLVTTEKQPRDHQQKKKKLSNTELIELYTNCIKPSTENVRSFPSVPELIRLINQSENHREEFVELATHRAY